MTIEQIIKKIQTILQRLGRSGRRQVCHSPFVERDSHYRFLGMGGPRTYRLSLHAFDPPIYESSFSNVARGDPVHQERLNFSQRC